MPEPTSITHIHTGLHIHIGLCDLFPITSENVTFDITGKELSYFLKNPYLMFHIDLGTVYDGTHAKFRTGFLNYTSWRAKRSSNIYVRRPNVHYILCNFLYNSMYSTGDQRAKRNWPVPDLTRRPPVENRVPTFFHMVHWTSKFWIL